MTLVALLPDHDLADAVGPVDGVELLVMGEEGDRRDEVEVWVAPYLTGTDALAGIDALPALRLVQVQTAGYDGMPDLLPDGVRLANARGVHDDATAELAVGLVVTALRGIDEAVRRHGSWHPTPGRRALADSRVLVLGYGSIGQALAERLLAMKARVTAVASRPREDDLVGRVHGVDELPALLGDADVLVVLLPHDGATHQLVGDGLLARLPDGCLVVNVGRGPVVDTGAVLAHAHRLRFALDVTDPEPLPDGHPLWSAPGVLVTPHIAGGTTAMLPRMAALVRDQLTAYAAGDAVANVVAP